MKKRLLTATLAIMTVVGTTTVSASDLCSSEINKRRAQGYYANGFIFTRDGHYWDYNNNAKQLKFNEELFVDFDTKGTETKEDDELLIDTVVTWGEVRNVIGTTYPQTLKVIDINRKSDIVTCQTTNGFQYTFTGCEDWDLEDSVSATMNDNGTEYVMDDYIVDCRYVAWELSYNPFSDVKETDWFYKSVLWARENGIMSGYTETTFAPNEKLTRAQAAAIIYRLYGEEVKYECNFTDVNKSDWYYDAVAWANHAYIVYGYGEEFGADDNVTREQFAAMMYRYANYLALDVTPKMESISVFNDAYKVNPYAQTALEWAYGYGLINGTTETTLSPQGNATRAECSAIVQRFIEAYPIH